MGTIGDILRAKGGTVFRVAPDAPLLDAVRVMNDARIGSVLVADARGTVAGILTERDLLTRVLAVGATPSSLRVQDVMTSDVVWCTPDTRIDDLRSTMRSRRIRHVPVRDARGVLCGMVSIGDLNAHETAELTVTVASLEQYIARG